MNQEKLAKLACGFISYLMGVIIFGAYVRASGSGAGCGQHWPLCNGVVIPQDPSIKTLIEFTHRLTSGISLPIAFFLVFMAFRILPKGHHGRFYGTLMTFFLITEGLIGAALVLLQHVAENTSDYRAVSMSLHLVNTYALMACAVLFWHSLKHHVAAFRGTKISQVLYSIGILLMVLTGLSGAITALGDTVFPLSEGMDSWKLSPETKDHLFVQLRVYHPLIAIGTGAYVILLCKWMRTSYPQVFPLAATISILVGIQLGAGFLNVRLMAPIWLQMVHLLLAETLWVCFILLGVKRHL